LCLKVGKKLNKNAADYHGEVKTHV